MHKVDLLGNARRTEMDTCEMGECDINDYSSWYVRFTFENCDTKKLHVKVERFFDTEDEAREFVRSLGCRPPPRTVN